MTNIVRFSPVNHTRFTEVEHSYINSYAEILLAVNLFCHCDFGQTEEGNEWYTFTDDHANTRLIFDKVGLNRIRVFRNGVNHLIEEPLDHYLMRFWGHLVASYKTQFDAIQTGQIKEMFIAEEGS